MTFSEWLSSQDPEAFFSVKVMQEKLRAMGGAEREEGSPGYIASLLGRSAKYWREHMPEIQGAYRDPVTERIYLPVVSCRAHLERKRQTGKRLRGPSQKGQEAEKPYAAQARPARLEKRPLSILRLKAVGRPENGDAKPEGRRVAGTGR